MDGLNNNENGQIERKNKLVVLVIILSILVILLIGYILVDKLVLDKIEKNALKQEPTRPVFTSSTTMATTKYIGESKPDNNSELTDDKIISLLKEYSKANNFYDESNTEFWNITGITYLGYYKEDLETKYFVVEGTFKCKDNSSDCVYLEQSIDNESDAQTTHIYKGGLSIKGALVSSLLPPTFASEIRAGEVEEFVIVDQKIK